jgi:hypothetical protein
MKTALILAAVLVAGLSPFAFAQPMPAPAPTASPGDLSLAEPGTVVVLPADPLAVPGAAAAAPSLENPVSFVKLVFTSVKSGNWWAAASALLVLVVSLLRTYGKKLHELIPDASLWDKPFWFVFDTKPGGWLLNIATAVAGGCGTALMAGEPVNWTLVKPILTVAVTGAALWEMGKDILEWFQARKSPPAAPSAPAPAAP